jgi:hypothetical protein
MKTIFPITLLSILIGCGSKDDPQENSCTAEIVFSVYATIYDDAGLLIENATVSYSVDDGAEGSCEMDGIGGHYCGEGEAGEVAIYVLAEGYEDAEETVTVEEDECHVTTEILDIELGSSE